jgi:nucleoside-diphosphate-sugar epimerase
MRALVIGGTGPSGPFVVNGLLARGYETAILHRGTHEHDAVGPEVEHVHTDVRSGDAVASALRGRNFDVAVVSYGRLREIAPALRGIADRLVTIGGFPAFSGYWNASGSTPPGLPVPVREDAAKVTSVREGVKAARVLETEAAVFAAFPDAIHLRYPIVYGPSQPVPREWCVVRRILDGRRSLVLPDSGLTIDTRGYVENVAHAVLCAVDAPKSGAGATYNVGDEVQLTLRQIVLVIADALGVELELVDMPYALAIPARPLVMSPRSTHRLFSVEALRADLGYRDVVSSVEATARTARWYAEHPLERGGTEERILTDPFDYAAEDALIAAWRVAEASVRDAINFEGAEPWYTLAYDPPTA